MRLGLTAGLFGALLLAGVPALAARGPDAELRAGIETTALTSPASAHSSPSPCGEPAEIGAADDCTLALDDEVTLAAELLVAKMGAAALEFALERATRHEHEQDSEAADIWRQIAARLAELAVRTGRAAPNR
jgi:hypothetical protein